MKNVFKPLVKSVLITLGLTAAAAAAAAANTETYSKEKFWIGYNNTSNFK